MPGPARPLPRLWTREELARDSARSIEAFVASWKSKGASAYRGYFAEAVEASQRLLESTEDLHALDSDHLDVRDLYVREVARYLAGPPLSEDDLRIIAGVRNLWTPNNAEKVNAVIRSVLDAERFPWLEERRRPNPIERREAIRWTARLLAAQKAGTARRSEPSKRQEKTVADRLLAPPLELVRVPARAIWSIRDIDAGRFCGQSEVGGSRADLTIGLRDRIRAIECKVSNSEVNSYKRLNHEVGDKAARWKLAFGDQVIPAAVLA